MHNELINPNSAIQDYECNIEDNRTINAKGNYCNNENANYKKLE